MKKQSVTVQEIREIGDDTIWAPAIVHFAAQAIAKLIVPSGENAWMYPFFVIAASAIVPLIVYALPKEFFRLDRRNGRPIWKFENENGDTVLF